MMEGHEKAIYRDLSSRHNDLSMEVNWNTESGDTVRLTIGDKLAVIKYEDLFSFVFLNGSVEQKADMLPTTQTVVTKFKKIHIVEAKKNITKGEKIKVRCEIDVPTTVVQALKGDVAKFTTISKPFITVGG